MSRGFVSALIGIGLTLLAWFGPWEWPAWPAFTLIELAFGTHTAFGELPFSVRAVTVTLLIIANVAFWGGPAWLLLRVVWRPRSPAIHP